MLNDADGLLFSYGILLFFVVLFVGKVWSYTRRPKRLQRLKRYRAVKQLHKTTWEEFELLVADLFVLQGWHVDTNAVKGADGGVDIWIKKRRHKAIVQCKRYEDAKVTVKVVREMYGLIYEYNVQSAFVVTSSGFTGECDRFVSDKPIELIDGERLIGMIRNL